MNVASRSKGENMRLAVAAMAFVGLSWTIPTSSQGAACSADYVLAPDHSALSILFNDLTVEASGPSAVECTIDVPLDLPEGMSLGVYRVDYRGFASLAKKDVATLQVSYELGPKGNGRNFKRSVRGALEDDFAFTENIGAGLMKRVGCGDDAHLRGSVSLSLKGSGESLATLDTGDGASRRGLVYRFNLKKC
jgi:hypothetical protein